MAGNPYYVAPLGGVDLTAQLGAMGEKVDKRKAEEKAVKRFSEMRQGFMEAYNSGDPGQVAAFVSANPEMSQAMNTSMQFRDEQDREGDLETFRIILSNPSNAAVVLGDRADRIEAEGGDASDERQLMLEAADDPYGLAKKIEMQYASLASKQEWEAFQATKEADDGLDLKDLEVGYRTYLTANGLRNTAENYKKYQEQKTLAKDYAPSPLQKLITERQEYIDGGTAVDDPIIKAYDSKISGVDIDIEDMTQDEVDTWGYAMMMGMKMPSFGRGKQATKVRMKIAKSAARQSLGADEDGIPDDPDRTPAEAALHMLGEKADTEAIAGSIKFLDKQLSSMGSFVVNLNSQIDKVKKLSKDLKTFDARIFNAPLRLVRGKIKGSALQAKYDMYLAEIESEIGKLATGSTGSIAELSATAQEKWSKIHDKNLSVKDMLSLLEETKQAANFRLESVQGQLDKTRRRIRRVDEIATESEEEFSLRKMRGEAEEPLGDHPVVTSQAEYDALTSGTLYMEDNQLMRKP